MKKIIYENLGQCVGERVVYIRSTDIEQMNWHRLLWSIPDEWFYQWACGNEVVLHEITNKRTGGKVKRIFAPVIIEVFSSLYNIKHLRSTEASRVLAHCEAAFEALAKDKSLNTRILFWKSRIEQIKFTVEVDIVNTEPNTVDKLIKNMSYIDKL